MFSPSMETSVASHGIREEAEREAPRQMADGLQSKKKGRRKGHKKEAKMRRRYALWKNGAAEV